MSCVSYDTLYKNLNCSCNFMYYNIKEVWFKIWQRHNDITDKDWHTLCIKQWARPFRYNNGVQLVWIHKSFSLKHNKYKPIDLFLKLCWQLLQCICITWIFFFLLNYLKIKSKQCIVVWFYFVVYFSWYIMHQATGVYKGVWNLIDKK